MSDISRSSRIAFLLATCAILAPSSASALQDRRDFDREDIIVSGQQEAFDAAMATQGPEIKGIISARNSDRFQVTADDGTQTIIAISEETRIKASGGFLGLNRNKLAADSLLNGLPVTVETWQWNGGLVANQIDLKNKDLKTANMIRTGTAQGFAEQTAATEVLRGRMGDIDQYNIKGTTNVYFDTARWKLSSQAENELCAAANQAEAMDNALLLVVGYTDSVGS